MPELNQGFVIRWDKADGFHIAIRNGPGSARWKKVEMDSMRMIIPTDQEGEEIDLSKPLLDA